MSTCFVESALGVALAPGAVPPGAVLPGAVPLAAPGAVLLVRAALVQQPGWSEIKISF